MKKSKIAACLIGSLLVTSMLGGCGKKKESTPTTEAELNITPVATMQDASDMQVISREGYVISDLTGEWIEEKYANQRPLCIMINNIIDAMPQSGISQADITFEMLVEGGITRYLCVFGQYDGLTKLGPVRSARPYYVTMSKMLDGYFAHVGWSDIAKEMIENDPNVDNLNGLTNLSTIMFYRDNSRVAPHNCYTDGEKIIAGIETDGYRTTHKDGFNSMFGFNYKDTPLNSGNKAVKVQTNFSESRTPWFEYNESDGRYYRFQYGEKQIDDQTNEQLSYKNVIVMVTQYSDIDGYLKNIDWNTGGEGYYITDGEYIPIKWKTKDTIQFYTEDGKQLKMNPGNTFITVFPYANPGVIIE